MAEAIEREKDAAVFDSIDDVQAMLARHRYVADRSLAVSIYLSVTLGKPLFLEGEAGVGKTEVAKVLAAGLSRRLIRLQCYEGLDVNHALYEWNYAKQILHIRLAETLGGEGQRDAVEREIFGPEFLIKRPLLQAIDDRGEPPAVLLIDEIDRADEEFEAFLLELLSDFQVTVPEIGAFVAAHPPLVVLTSNRTREVHDALKRRCLYHWIDYPNVEREAHIVESKVPGVSRQLALEACALVASLRADSFYKHPGIAETIDWAAALVALGQTALDERVVAETIGCVLKYQEDVKKAREPGLSTRVERARKVAAQA
ncbi:MAG TPA: MoxR family ATPase [Candidatus Tumulicola sp.]|nr:MoxR family ATPase [Candidatus Tumulicola sp.]